MTTKLTQSLLLYPIIILSITERVDVAPNRVSNLPFADLWYQRVFFVCRRHTKSKHIMASNKVVEVDHNSLVGKVYQHHQPVWSTTRVSNLQPPRDRRQTIRAPPTPRPHKAGDSLKSIIGRPFFLTKSWPSVSLFQPSGVHRLTNI
jgi:hypothetical protein